MICEQWDVLVVPFPFTDVAGTKRRPALVMSRRAFNSHGHSVLAMITTKAEPDWPGDTRLHDLGEAGLRVACLVRLKLFTVDNRLIADKIGRLSPGDQRHVERALATYILPAGRSRRRA